MFLVAGTNARARVAKANMVTKGAVSKRISRESASADSDGKKCGIEPFLVAEKECLVVLVQYGTN